MGEETEHPPWDAGHQLIARDRCCRNRQPQPQQFCSLAVPKRPEKYGAVTGGWGASLVVN